MEQHSLSPDSSEDFIKNYDTYADAMFRHCFLRVYDREQAKDLVQEIFLRAWRYVQKGNRVDNMRALLYRIANNLIIDEARKRKSAGGQHSSVEDLVEIGQEPSQDTRGQLMAKIEVGLLQKILAQLEDSDRRLILLRYMEGLEPREIAEILNESPNVTSVRLHRAIKKLQALLPL